MDTTGKVYYCIDCNRPIKHKGRCMLCQGVEDRRVPNVAQAAESWYNGNISDTKKWLKHCTKKELLLFVAETCKYNKSLEDIMRLLE